MTLDHRGVTCATVTPLGESEPVVVYNECHYSTCPGGFRFDGIRVPCDPTVHASDRRHDVNACVCGHLMHGGHACRWCLFLGEHCEVARHCGAERHDGLDVRITQIA